VSNPPKKMKTHKGAKKRFKITATGKVMRTKGMKSHNRRKKAPRDSVAPGSPPRRCVAHVRRAWGVHAGLQRPR
jgi:hypothetical protein